MWARPVETGSGSIRHKLEKFTRTLPQNMQYRVFFIHAPSGSTIEFITSSQRFLTPPQLKQLAWLAEKHNPRGIRLEPQVATRMDISTHGPRHVTVHRPIHSPPFRQA